MNHILNSPDFKQDYSTLLSNNPFSYDLGINIIPPKTPSSKITICCHGYGQNNQIANTIHSQDVLDGYLVGFNFPDYYITEPINPKSLHFGTITEILPLLFILKKIVCDLEFSKINLYGFSAGGAAIINALAILGQKSHENALQEIGINQENITEIISALEKGIIILDCPLKSLDEVIAIRGATPELQHISDQYAKNNMRPIDALEKLSSLTLTVILHFQNPDEIIGNKDDSLFNEKLKKANKGKTFAIIDSDGGHNTFHSSLWKFVKNF